MVYLAEKARRVFDFSSEEGLIMGDAVPMVNYLVKHVCKLLSLHDGLGAQALTVFVGVHCGGHGAAGALSGLGGSDVESHVPTGMGVNHPFRIHSMNSVARTGERSLHPAHPGKHQKAALFGVL